MSLKPGAAIFLHKSEKDLHSGNAFCRKIPSCEPTVGRDSHRPPDGAAPAEDKNGLLVVRLAGLQQLNLGLSAGAKRRGDGHVQWSTLF